MKMTVFKGVLVLLPAILFFVYLYIHALNVPFMDDMDLISSINDIKQSPSNFFEILYRQQNDHRILFSRLGMLIIYFFTEEINFRYTILLGFFNLVLLAYAFYLVYSSFRRGLGLFLPVIIVLFSPTVYAVHLWSITSFQYTLSVAFSIISLYFLQEKKKSNWYWALPFALASTLTNLDSLSVLPIGLFWLLTQRRYRESLLFALLSVVWLGVYFFNFQFSSATKLEFTPEFAFIILSSFVSFVGSAAKVLSDTNAVALSIILGGFILFGYAVLFLYRHAEEWGSQSTAVIKPFRLEFIDMCFLRLMATSAMIAIGRSYDGIEVMMAIRFQVFSISILILFYLLLVRTLQINRLMAGLFISASILINVYSYLKYDRAVTMLTQSLKADSYNYTHNQLFLHQYYNLPDPPRTFYKNYKFPEFFHKSIINTWQKSSSVSNSIKITAKKVLAQGIYSTYLYPILDMEIHNAPDTIPHNEAFLTLQSRDDSTRCYLVSLHEKNNWLKSYSINSSSSRTFCGSLPMKLPKDTYKMRLCWVENNHPKSILISSEYTL